MGVELVREGIRVAGDGGMVGGEKQILRLQRGITKSEGAKNAREMGCPGGGERKVSRLRGVARKAGDSASLEMTKKAQLKLTRKQRGEMAEAAFLAKAAALGFRVSKPWGESSRYDLIVDNGRRLLRVQVKSAHRAAEYGGYTFHAHGNTTRVYEASEIDLLAAYVVPVDAWYLFPVEEFRKYKAMKLFPASRRRRSKFEKFRENWGIVR
jgi:Holliday junction resolvase-like predicted endonuclease